MGEMTPWLGEPGAALLALAGLLLWPGLLVVRAPWPYVPFLSIAFWLVTWAWLAPTGPGRSRFLIATLAFSAILCLLRLLKPSEASRPSWPALGVSALALSRLVPYFLWPAAPGLDSGFGSASTLLLAWRDGLPGSYLPLYPILGFGLDGLGLAAVAADASLLGALPAYRAFLLATLASEGLLVLAIFALARRFWPESWAFSSASTIAALGLLAGVGREAGGEGVLALALAIAAASLVVPSHDRSPGVAAGLLGAGCAAVSALLGAVGGVAIACAAVATRGSRGLGRLGLPATVCAILAAPVLWRVSDAGRLFVPGPLAAALLLLVVVGIPVAARRVADRPPLPPWMVAGSAAIAVIATAVDWQARSAQVLVTTDDLAAAAWLRAHSRPTDVICAQDPVARSWIPALAGRAASPPIWPTSFLAARAAPDLPACAFVWEEVGRSPPEVAFRHGRVSLRRAAPVGP
jgi:hypothetical protein